MSAPLTVECNVEFRRLAKGHKQIQEAPATPRSLVQPGRVPRVSRWMALALRFEQLLQEGHIASYAEFARLGHVTHARISQIMNLPFLAPDIQQAILFLPRTQRGRDPIILRDLQLIAAQWDWREQRRLWAKRMPRDRQKSHTPRACFPRRVALARLECVSAVPGQAR